ncbi:hypothetical protein IQ07DRAFT_638586 [Pyrenochaeta sp. DS3sAY3a]|nr:hypothetical protein IQ07DRAFT_638586 [Pyrenochaeta sp. DS3sAY3a]
MPRELRIRPMLAHPPAPWKDLFEKWERPSPENELILVKAKYMLKPNELMEPGRFPFLSAHERKWFHVYITARWTIGNNGHAPNKGTTRRRAMADLVHATNFLWECDMEYQDSTAGIELLKKYSVVADERSSDDLRVAIERHFDTGQVEEQPQLQPRDELLGQSLNEVKAMDRLFSLELRAAIDQGSRRRRMEEIRQQRPLLEKLKRRSARAAMDFKRPRLRAEEQHARTTLETLLNVYLRRPEYVLIPGAIMKSDHEKLDEYVPHLLQYLHHLSMAQARQDNWRFRVVQN